MKPGSLSAEQVHEFRQNGCLFPLRAMSQAQANGYLSKLVAFRAEYGDKASETLRSKSHLALTWVNALIRLEPVLDAVESLIGPDIYCWSTSFFIKQPRDPGFIAWHQDAPYSGMPEGAGTDMVTAWLALTPSNQQNGCLKVVAGSHTEVVKHEYRGNATNLLSLGQEIAVDVDEGTATKIVLEPGEFSFHHQMIIHGSEPNTSDGPRVGLAIRYVRPYQRPSPNTKDTATLVRGVDRYNTFFPEPAPAADMDAAAVAYLDQLLVQKYGARYRKATA